MKKFQRAGSILALLVMTSLAACQKEEGLDPRRQPDTSYQPEIEASGFPNSTALDNLYFPNEAGKVYFYERQTEEGLERSEVKRLSRTQVVMGIECVVVEDALWRNGILLERGEEYYAQDEEGNVWHFGEEVDNYNAGGVLINHNGSWEAGVDGALPGIVMPANPQVGQSYRQQYFFNLAEDEAEVMEAGLALSIPWGAFGGCIKIKEWSALEPEVLEYKFYAPGIGLIKAINVTDNEEQVLVEVRG
ncbi:MAG: hypothetical protein J5I94_00050 [Phaeodactylibacter sp.]|nr:hypothetical protein [Phaeodactylibacter sp.]